MKWTCINRTIASTHSLQNQARYHWYHPENQYRDSKIGLQDFPPGMAVDLGSMLVFGGGGPKLRSSVVVTSVVMLFTCLGTRKLAIPRDATSWLLTLQPWQRAFRAKFQVNSQLDFLQTWPHIDTIRLQVSSKVSSSVRNRTAANNLAVDVSGKIGISGLLFFSETSHAHRLYHHPVPLTLDTAGISACHEPLDAPWEQDASWVLWRVVGSFGHCQIPQKGGGKEH